MAQELIVKNSRTDIQLSLSNDQYDDLTSALETYRDKMSQFAEQSINGFGLDTAYWSQRITEIQHLLEAVHRLAAGENPEAVNGDLAKQAQEKR